MTLVTKDSSQTNSNWIADQVNNALEHLIPLTIKIGAGSILTWSNPNDVTVAFVAQSCFFHAGYLAVDQLDNHFLQNPHQRCALSIANLGLSFFAGKAVAERLGFSPSYLSMGVGMASMIGVAAYQVFRFVQSCQKSPFKEDSKVISVTNENFKEEVENSQLPVILDVYANWCPPCKMVAPIIEDLCEEMEGKVKFVKMNIEQEAELTEKLGIKAMPTFIYFKDGQEVHRQEGAGPREHFLNEINEKFA